jgi:hypothetical protein
MGCHHFDPVFRALDIKHPVSIHASSTLLFDETAPAASIIHFEFPARESMPPLHLTWYDGGLKPRRPPELENERKLGRSGMLFIGDRGVIMCSGTGSSPRLIPEKKMQEYRQPPKTIPRSIGHYETMRSG